MIDVLIPAYYILGRDLPEDKFAAVHAALDHTPPICAVVHRSSDRAFAAKFHREVVQAAEPTLEGSSSLASEISSATDRAVLLISEGSALQACFSDGTSKEIIPCT